MKLLFTKIASFFLAIGILYTTSSYAVDMHFCGNTLVDTAVFGKAKICKDGLLKSTSSSKNCSVQQKNCCNHQTIVKLGDNAFNKLNPENETETFIFQNTYFYTYSHLFEGQQENKILFEEYLPPLISKDIYILNETLLI
tara:strand:- start:919 stop:1338 length:420 start_codon:yes stop_codon:yes gene_type:complete